MDENMRYFLQLVKCSIYGEKPSLPESNNIDWKVIQQCAAHSQLLGIMQTTIEGLEAEIGEERFLLWKNTVIHQGAKQFIAYMELGKVLQEAKKRNITMVLFKGAIVAQLYPDFLLRNSSDVDIYVNPKEHKAAMQLLEELQFLYEENSSKEKVPVYFKPNVLVIELHSCLWEDYQGKKMDILDSFELTNPNTYIKMKACDLDVTTLGYEEHLIYQIYHVIKHFSLDGIGLRYLTDITLYVNRYIDEIDYHSFWSKMEKLDYAVFSCYIFKLCIKYFNMNPSMQNESYDKSNMDEERLLYDLINTGCIDDNERLWQVMRIMQPYLCNGGKVYRSKAKLKCSILFPSADKMPDRYAYTKRFPILLPIAWGERAIRHLFHQFFLKNGDTTYQQMDKAMYRLDLMKDLGLIEEE